MATAGDTSTHLKLLFHPLCDTRSLLLAQGMACRGWKGARAAGVEQSPSPPGCRHTPSACRQWDRGLGSVGGRRKDHDSLDPSWWRGAVSEGRARDWCGRHIPLAHKGFLWSSWCGFSPPAGSPSSEGCVDLPWPCSLITSDIVSSQVSTLGTLLLVAQRENNTDNVSNTEPESHRFHVWRRWPLKAIGSMH